LLVYARLNQIGWIHLWRSVQAYEEGEASAHFFNSRTDPRWRELVLTEAQRRILTGGGLLELEDPGYLEDESDIG
jgi:hypothetical protein